MKGYRRLYNRVRHDQPHDHPHGYGHVRGESHGASAGWQTGAREKSIRRHCAHRHGAGVQTRCPLEKLTRCLGYTKHSEWGLYQSPKKKQGQVFYRDPCTPSKRLDGISPNDDRPGETCPVSFQIRERKGTGLRIVTSQKR